MNAPSLKMPNDNQLALVSHDATRHLGENFPVPNLEDITVPYFRAALDTFGGLYEEHYRQVVEQDRDWPEARAQLSHAIITRADLDPGRRYPLATAISQCIAYEMLNYIQRDTERPEHDQLISSATFADVYRYLATAARVVGRGFVAQLINHDPQAQRTMDSFRKRQHGIEAVREFYSPEGMLYQHVLVQSTQGERCVHERYAIRSASHLRRPSQIDTLSESPPPVQLVGQCGNGVYEEDVNQVANFAVGESLTSRPGTAAHLTLRREMAEESSDDHRYLAIRPDADNIIVLRWPAEAHPKKQAAHHQMRTQLLKHFFDIKRPRYAEIREQDL